MKPKCKPGDLAVVINADIPSNLGSIVRVIETHDGSGPIVDNRPGANGQIAVDLVKGGDADGSNMLFTPDFRMTVFPHSHRKLNYDPLRDFAPVAICSKGGLTLPAQRADTD